MGLAITKPTKLGVTASYWRILSITAFRNPNSVGIVFGGYSSKDASDAGVAPLAHQEEFLTAQEITDHIDFGQSLFLGSYNAVKTRERVMVKDENGDDTEEVESTPFFFGAEDE